MSDKKFEMSRRNALIGLGTVGAASAGAGVGTSAYFTDEENLQNNTIQAGKLNVYANFEGSVNQGMADPSNTSISNSSDIDGSVLTGAYQIGDAKPGDSGSFTVDVCNADDSNPAYAFVAGELTDNSENGYAEPEPKTGSDENDPNTSSGGGELQDKITVTNVDGLVSDPSPTTLGDLLTTLSNGVQVTDEDGDGALSPEECQSVTVDWEIKTGVGNRIMTDSLEFSLAVGAVQARHNTNPNGTSPLNDSS